MENKINVAELLKNCPRGMELDCAMFDDVYFDCIEDLINNPYPILCYRKVDEETLNIVRFSEYGAYTLHPDAKCIIFPKSKPTWEGFVPPCEFKNGDILAAGDWVFIFKEFHPNGSPKCYCHYDLTLEEFKVDTNSYMACGGDIYLATKEQQDLLFSEMEGAGYKWNAETKTLDRLINPRFKVGDRIKHINSGEVATVVGVKETHYNLDSKVGTSAFTIPLQHEWDLVSKFDISTLKPFDRVLVRDCIKTKWRIQFFDRFKETGNFPFICVGDVVYKQCIPYEGNEHLRGTRDDCAEFYKTWRCDYELDEEGTGTVKFCMKN